MPIYTCKCPNCDYEDSYILTFKEYIDGLNVPRCIHCDIPMVHQIGTPMIKLKGDGWAKDGYSKSPNKKESKTEE